MPIAAASVHIPYLDDVDKMNLWRIGNIVVAFANIVVSNLGAYDTEAAAEVIPSGFRPTSGTAGLFILNAVAGSSNSTMSVAISASGSTNFSNRSTISSSTRFNGYGAWITKDNWPS